MPTTASASTAPFIKERVIDTRRIALNVREVGDGPVAIFLHGITAAGAVWDPVLQLVASKFRAIAVDQRGHGRSDKPDGEYSADAFAQDVVALIRTLDCGPAVVVGHSLGARNAVVAAVQHPDLVRAVVAVDFTPFIEDEVFEALEARVNGGDRPFASLEEIESYLQNRYVNLPPDAVRRRALHAYHRVGEQFRPLASPSAMAATARGLREELASALESVKVPVQLVRGAESKLVSPAAWDRTKKLRPDLPAIEVRGTDHYVPEEAPAAIATTVLKAGAV
ncbi:alpha/beta hydrolase [Tardiphaga sp. P9-11]|jgi:2-(acetamidomethylene)succinate hydrolase|uniref:alpha/beta fold hydrolase n=1 Tax=Tardiphaga sp. P9-11 TaxID=2024614 RepID=UPI0011F145B4|nr:alpha/beta hydrolase [Tardiphaga sp. P9-11]KAA0069919.1 alpha/beta hydrolase [Tardiphaga sp. P9-11]